MVSWSIDVDDGSLSTPDSEETTVTFTAEFDPPIPLSNLHRRLERLWLKSREK